MKKAKWVIKQEKWANDKVKKSDEGEEKNLENFLQASMAKPPKHFNSSVLKLAADH